MKKTIFILSIAMFMGGMMLTGCQSSAKKVEKARENVAIANQELSQARKDSIQQFKREAAERISKNEKEIADYKIKIANEKKGTKASIEKTLADLEQKNNELKKTLDDYKEEGLDHWSNFKDEFNHDMDELGDAFSNLVKKNVN